MTNPTRPSLPELSRRRLLAAGTGLGAAAVLGIRPATAAARSRASTLGASSDLDVFVGDYPRAWFFRQTESTHNYATYEEWELRYRHLNGIQGKGFPEENPNIDPARNRDFFTQFKDQHPEQVVLLHLNGTGRRLVFNGEAFSAGHWLYYAGTSAAAAGPSSETLEVADASVFKMERLPVLPGMPDDIVIVPPGSGGLDWAGAEHASIVSIDYGANAITVQRGQFGTSPIEVPAGSYVAPHVRQRYGAPPPLNLWVYNYSNHRPARLARPPMHRFPGR